MDTTELCRCSEKYQELLLNDIYRPTYHFACPGDHGCPGDPNGAFFADGVYHLMYLYRNHSTNAFHWGHLTSLDLLHWRRLPDALTAEEGDEGCFSGGAFLDEDGTAYLTYWKFPSAGKKADFGGIQIACSKAPYEVWERITPIAVESREDMWGVTDLTVNGEVIHTACADPSNIWKKNGFYYMQLGNLEVLNKFGREKDSDPQYRGGWTDLYRSADMRHWEYRGRFYAQPEGSDMPDQTEDDMCPSFLPLPDAPENGRLTEKMLQLFIAHNRGTQYFIGTEREERLLIEQHGRMSWKDNCYFAPEALIDGKNRHIIWAWLLDRDPEGFFREHGWGGVYSFPRTVWYEDGSLRMAPAGELDRISRHRLSLPIGKASFTGIVVPFGKLCRIRAALSRGTGSTGAFRVFLSPDGTEYTEVGVDFEKQVLFVDTTRSHDGRRIREEAPLSVGDGEDVSLDIFLDKTVVEVYADHRQAICRLIYPSANADGIAAVGDGTDFGTVCVYEMFPTNFY